jgi:hypothetical protein
MNATGAIVQVNPFDNGATWNNPYGRGNTGQGKPSDIPPERPSAGGEDAPIELGLVNRGQTTIPYYTQGGLQYYNPDNSPIRLNPEQSGLANPYSYYALRPMQQPTLPTYQHLRQVGQ